MYLVCIASRGVQVRWQAALTPLYSRFRGWLQICGFRHFNNIGHYTFDTVTLNNVVCIDGNQPVYGCQLMVRQAFSYSNESQGLLVDVNSIICIHYNYIK